MKTINLGDTRIEVPNICLGTMTFGEQNNEQEAHDQLDYALAQGLNFIDTAEMYPVPPRAETQGSTERFVGNWLAGQNRSDIFLATKATGPARKMDWIREGKLHFSRDSLRRALDGSLQRLGTDYVDLYQLHWPDRNVPMFGAYHYDPRQERPAVTLQESMAALADLIRQGLVRHWGLSNETPWGLMTALQHADQAGLPRPVSVQNAYGLLNRCWEAGMSEIAYRERITLLAYSPLAFGLLSGKYLDNPQARGRVTIFEGFAQRYSKPNVHRAVAAYAELARGQGLTPTELALAFTYSQPGVCTIIGATSMEQLRENIAAGQTELSQDCRREIEAIHLRYTNPAP